MRALGNPGSSNIEMNLVLSQMMCLRASSNNPDRQRGKVDATIERFLGITTRETESDKDN